MSLRRAAVFALVTALMAPQAFAQDDLFAPLEPQEGAKSKKKSSKAKAPKKPAAKTGKASTAKKSQAPAPAEDELFMPMMPTKTQFLVKLSGEVKGARLFIDNKPAGTLPLSAPIELEAGEYTVSVRRPGFTDFSRRVMLEAGKPAEVAVTLEAVAGVLSVSADVSGASVAIDGQPRGQVPLTGILLKPGSHEVVVTAEGYEPNLKALDIRAGRDYTVAANMKPAMVSSSAVAHNDTPQNTNLLPPDSSGKLGPKVPPLTPDEPEVRGSQPWFKRWYVWAGVGAVVTAAAVGTVVATQGGAATPLSPETVCGGACDGTINGIVRF
jgi:hypothetical protein